MENKNNNFRNSPRTRFPPDIVQQIQQFFPEFSLENSFFVYQDLEAFLKSLETQELRSEVEKYILAKLKLKTFCNIFHNNSLNYAKILEQFQLDMKQEIREDPISQYYSNDDFPNIKDILSDVMEKKNNLRKVQIMKDMSNQDLEFLLEDIYNFNQEKIPYLERILCFFPDFLQKYQKTLNFLMIGEGPLPIDWRFYIAIMAVSVYGCQYWFNRLAQLFIFYGGDESWLIKGVEQLPSKLKKLSDLNSLMAFQSWTIFESKTIEVMFEGNEKWNISELLLASAIIAFFHGFSCFVYGNGINSEPQPINIDYIQRNHPYQNNKNIQHSDQESSLYVNNEILNILNKLEDSNQEEILKDKSLKQGVNQKKEKKQTHALIFEDQREQDIKINTFAFEKYISKSITNFSDFSPRSNRVLHCQDFSWAASGYNIANEFFPELAQCLQSQIDYVAQMTQKQFLDNEHVNTQPFRKSIWYYIENINGYHHDDYDYKLVNLLLPKEFKTFLKNIATNPTKIDSENFRNIKLKLTPEEKCHFSLLVIHAKLQLEFVYILEYVQKKIS